MKQEQKRDFNKELRRFNSWFDEFILTAAKPLSMVGFAMGTVDIFNRGGMATNPWFAFAWSVVQAVTIDGLFFAVWYRLFEQGISRWRRVWLGLIGLVLAVVVVITNSILGFQQLWGVADSQSAMIRLGIDPGDFTLVRAVLVVIVAIMVAFVARNDTDGDTGTKSIETLAHSHQPSSENSDQPGENTTARHETGVVITETENDTPLLEMRLGETLDILTENFETPRETTSETNETGETLSEKNENIRENNENVMVFSSETVRQAAREAVRTDRDLNLTKFSQETGIPKQTLYRWRREATPETTTV